MSNFDFQNAHLCAEEIPLERIATEFSTPCYIYSQQAILKNWQEYVVALKISKHPYRIFYAVKANSNLAILKLLSKHGAGFDCVSGGEISRAIAAGAAPAQIIFSGVGKSTAEITQAISLGIYCINIESEAELSRVAKIARHLDKKVKISFRINPDVKIDSHPYISTGSKQNKFGIDFDQAIRLYKLAADFKNIKITGITCHIGSQITSVEPFKQALDQLVSIVNQLKEYNINIEYIDIGGGLGVRYKDEIPPTPKEYIDAILSKVQDTNMELHIEPGRSIVANSGILLTRIEYLKTTGEHNFAIIDAAMNDLIRPALYESYHEIVPIHQPHANAELKKYSIVGPVCESGDFLGKDRLLDIKAGDLLAIKSVGAYGMSMASNYNTRPRCAELLVDGNKISIIRQRETIEQLLANESISDVPRSI